MKRYEALLADMEGPGYLTPAADGGWMRYEDHAAKVALLTAALEAAEKRAENERIAHLDSLKMGVQSEERAEALQARVAELEAEKAQWQTTARINTRHMSTAEAELADLRGRVEQAIAALSVEPVRGSDKLVMEILRGR